MSEFEFTPLLPEGWERAKGYAHGVRSAGGRRVHIAGKTGTLDGSPGGVPGGDFAMQFEAALAGVVEVMKAAGGSAENITMMRLYVTSLSAYREAGAAVGAAWKKVIGRHFPAMTLVEVSGLLNPDALVEIEAEGVLP